MCDRCTRSLPANVGSRRRRLWDLPHQCHCPVVGVCFPLSTLRQLVNKALGGKAMADDYEVHVGAVAECTKRNRLSEMLQQDLEARYARSVQAFKVAKSAKAVADLWAEAVRNGDVSGAFWATLTHPRCDEILQEVVLRDMHMLQHQAGAAIRVDAGRFNELIKENGVLARELGRAQERCTRVIAEKAAEVEHFQAQLVQQRAIAIGKDSRIAFLVQDMEELKAVLTTQRQGDTARESPVTFHLKEKTVLCVGGRNGNVANYREVIEKAGGHFAHHDGGLEDSHAVLDSVLVAADLVICQTGCISHNAYWRVKDFCKRTGKQCVFVENPSTSSLTRSLQQAGADDKAAETAENPSAV